MTELQNNHAAKGRIIAVCSAPKKGMIKHDIGEGTLIEGIGLEGDAHAGFMHRQVSLIAMEDIRTMMAKLPNLVPGSFAENLTTEGFDLGALKIGDRLRVGETLLELARADRRIVGITPAMPSGCSLNIMMREMPDRCFDVGIAEGHAVTFSAGLAAGGLHPVCNIYSSFMQRAYDNIIHDVALQRLPVTLCIDRAGIVGEDGATHHGSFDLAYLSCIPDIIVAAPMNELELRNMLYTAVNTPSPYAIRYPRGCGEGVEWRGVPYETIPTGKGRRLKDGKNMAVITIGTAGNLAAEAIERIESRYPVTIAHYDLRFAKPLDEALLREAARFDRILTVEDGILRGGVGEAVAKFFSDNGLTSPVRSLGIDDKFVEHGTVAQLQAICGYDADGIERTIKEML